MNEPNEPKKDELSDDELEGATGGAGTTIKPQQVKPQISITKIPNKLGPTAPGFDPGKVMHSPNNST